jgi:hypothetical protein
MGGHQVPRAVTPAGHGSQRSERLGGRLDRKTTSTPGALQAKRCARTIEAAKRWRGALVRAADLLI